MLYLHPTIREMAEEIQRLAGAPSPAAASAGGAVPAVSLAPALSAPPPAAGESAFAPVARAGPGRAASVSAAGGAAAAAEDAALVAVAARVGSALAPCVLAAQLLAALLAVVLRYCALVPGLLSLVAAGQALGLGAAVALTGPIVVLAFAAAALASVAARWAVLGFRRPRPGLYPAWGREYLRWWAARAALAGAAPALAVVQGSPAHNALLRLLGARVGRGAVVDTSRVEEPELVEVGGCDFLLWRCRVGVCETCVGVGRGRKGGVVRWRTRAAWRRRTRGGGLGFRGV